MGSESLPVGIFYNDCGTKNKSAIHWDLVLI